VVGTCESAVCIRFESSNRIFSIPTGVPQGSVLGLLFSCYIPQSAHWHHPLATICRRHLNLHGLNSFWFSCSAELSRLSSCLSALHNWFCLNGLASSKSESILFGTRQRVHSFPTVSSPTISGSTIQISDSIKILSVTLDNHRVITGASL